MKHDVQILEEKCLVYCTLEGVPDVEKAVQLALSLRKQASDYGFNVLYDARKMEVPSSVMPAYKFSTQLSSSINDLALRQVKVAFLYDSGQFEEQWRFWETVSVNRGLQFKGFTDENDAIEWLSPN